MTSTNWRTSSSTASIQFVGVDRVLYVSCGENFAPPVAVAAPHTSLAAATLAPGPAASVNSGVAGGTCPTKTTRVNQLMPGGTQSTRFPQNEAAWRP